MKKGKLGKNRARWVIVCGFVLLYFACMFMMTYTVQQDFEEDYTYQMDQMLRETQKMIRAGAEMLQEHDALYDENGDFSEEMKAKIQRTIKYQLNNTDRFLMINMGLIDEQENLLVGPPDSMLYQEVNEQTSYSAPDWIETKQLVFRQLDFSEYFSEKEMEEILSYYEEAEKDEFQKQGRKYEYKLYYDEDTEKMVFFLIKEVKECRAEKNGMINGMIVTDWVEGKTVFQWISPDYIPPKTLETQSLYDMSSGDITSLMNYPYLQYGRQYWEKWKNDEILQNLEASEGIHFSTWMFWLGDSVDMDTEELYGIRINYWIHSWQAAFNHLADIYAYSVIIMALCLAIVLYILDQTYKKQAQLEVTRRDFTNAVAHELKTPLAVVRNLAENIEEEEAEEQKSYYTQEIINQTEIMDGLVQEMIFLSKLDSDSFVLKEAPVSVTEMLEEQMKKLDHLIDENNLQVQYWKEEDFVITGDKSCLEKAVFNLLENAVAYNRTDGRISVHVEKNKCTIENTADPIPEEDLAHVCEIFFTGNKSRTSDERHKGLGLYLAKRIFEMHHMKLKVQNSDVGVKVTFEHI